MPTPETINSCNYVEKIWKISNHKETQPKEHASRKFPAVIFAEIGFLLREPRCRRRCRGRKTTPSHPAQMIHSTCSFEIICHNFALFSSRCFWTEEILFLEPNEVCGPKCMNTNSELLLWTKNRRKLFAFFRIFTFANSQRTLERWFFSLSKGWSIVNVHAWEMSLSFLKLSSLINAKSTLKLFANANVLNWTKQICFLNDKQELLPMKHKFPQKQHAAFCDHLRADRNFISWQVVVLSLFVSMSGSFTWWGMKQTLCLLKQPW